LAAKETGETNNDDDDEVGGGVIFVSFVSFVSSVLVVFVPVPVTLVLVTHVFVTPVLGGL
jgi:hypothetical protein